MTINSQLDTIATSIAGLTITGVTIKDIDNIPDSAQGLTPLLIPQPNDYVTNLKPTRISFGGAGSAKMDLTYTLNYVYLHAEAGSGINTFAIYAGLIDNLLLIIESMMTNDNLNGAVDMELNSISDIGVIDDPAGNPFWGVFISLNVTEFTQ